MAKPPSLLFDTLIPAIDQDGKDIWNLLNEEQQKSAKGDFWTLNRYISSVQNSDRETQEHFLLTVNEFYNKGYFTTVKHPKLAWTLLCMCSHPSKKKYFHEWIPLKKEKDKKVQFLLELFPNMKISDVETLAKITTDKEIKKYCEGLGWDKKEVNGIKL